ncbi:MAG: hypothetical protein SGILL_009011 [Bacillariaceae sp.]
MKKANKVETEKGSQDQSPLAFFTSLDVESLVVDPVDGATAPPSKKKVKSPVGDAISNADAAARKILSDARKAFNLTNSRDRANKRADQQLSRVIEKDTASEEDSHLWSSNSNNVSGSIESLLLNRIHDVAAFADEHVVGPTGEAILKSGEVISHMGSLLRSREAKEQDDEAVSKKDSGDETSDPPVIDIHLPGDGDEVELIARSSDEEEYDNFTADPDNLLRNLQALDMQDLTMSPMTLRLIRGKDLPFENTRLRVSVLNEAGQIDQVLGTTAWTETSREPVWGTAAYSWSIMGTPSTCFVFALEEMDNPMDDTVAEKKEEFESEEAKPNNIFAKVAAVDLLGRKKNPNAWIRLTDHASANHDKCGSIRLRLSRPRRAVLHQQENCPRITPGPAFPRMESYAIRKKAMYSCSPVILNVYDVSNDSRVETVNNTVKNLGYGGIFHAAIQIYGREFSYGGTRDRYSKISGVFTAPSKQCPMHHYRESVYLGDCELSLHQINCILEDLRPKWLAREYNLFRKNCAFFSRKLAIELGVGDIPEWVFSLATTAEFIEPYAIQLNNYITNRTKTQASPAKAPTPKPKSPDRRTILSREASQVLAVALEEDGSMEAHHATASPQDALLDHAMAARIQRSFRAASSRKLPVGK